MGKVQSRDYKINLYNNIIENIQDLIANYSFWVNNDLCESISVVYYDKLIQYKHSDLIDASAAIGIKFTKDNKAISMNDKHTLCLNIIEHYKKRITLLQFVMDEIEKNRNKIITAQTGPVCRGLDMYVDNFFNCQHYGGIWHNKEQYQTIITNLKKAKLHDKWLSHITNLESKWKSYLYKLSKIIDSIKKDLDNTINITIFNDIDTEARLLIRKLNYIADIYYLLAINYG